MHHISFCYEAIQVLNNDVMHSKEVATKYYGESGNKQWLELLTVVLPIKVKLQLHGSCSLWDKEW